LFFGGWSLHLVGADAKVDGGGGCASELLLESLGERVDRGEAKKTDLSDARRELNRRDGYEVVFLVTKQEEAKSDWAPPKFGVIKRFIPGTVQGRALVYSQADRRFVCGGEIEARNSPILKVPSRGEEGVLKRDLEVQLRRQIASGISALAAPQDRPQDRRDDQ
jgi:hypothetical protein